ncbi:MAG: radical SAM protein [Calditrichaeota bacterium]|nr:radical SAM protein [Calditrichota bacterium]
MNGFEPTYLRLFKNGILKRRVEALVALLEDCTVCPRNCRVNRLKGEEGYCLAGRNPYITSVCDHHGEEPVLSGFNGSGTVFFGGCNLRCVFCQNYQISQKPQYFRRFEITVDQLAKNMIELQNTYHVHNINFVSPSHFVPQMVEAVYRAVPLGLNIPIVYNSNGYDSLEVLKLLDGIVDIYLPDFKYYDNQNSKKYSGVGDYVPKAKAALKEMYRQVGDLKVDKRGIAQRGLIIRHLILPNDLAGSEKVLEWIAAELSPSVAVSLMAQYYPTHKAHRYPLISRRIRYNEYLKALQKMVDLGMDRGFAQNLDAPDHYLPDFEKDGHPFE